MKAEKEKVIMDMECSQDGHEQSISRIKRQKTLLRKFKIRFIFSDTPHDSYTEYEVDVMNKHDALLISLGKLTEDSLHLDEVNSIILRSCA